MVPTWFARPDRDGVPSSRIEAMARRTPATFAKRQREMEKKRIAAEKRLRRHDRTDEGPAPEPEITICKPIIDEEQP